MINDANKVREDIAAVKAKHAAHKQRVTSLSCELTTCVECNAISNIGFQSAAEIVQNPAAIREFGMCLLKLADDMEMDPLTCVVSEVQ